VLLVCSVVTELVMEALSVLCDFLLMAGNLEGSNRYLQGVLQVGGLLNCLLVLLA